MKASLVNKVVSGQLEKEKEQRKEEEDNEIGRENIRIQDVIKWTEHGITKELRQFIRNKREKNRDRLGSLKIEELEFVNAIELVYRELEQEIDRHINI